MAKRSDWRVYANKVIVAVIKENPELAEKELRKKISEAYPFGERAMHPYKIWCSEVARCLFTLKGIGTKRQIPNETKEQTKLF